MKNYTQKSSVTSFGADLLKNPNINKALKTNVSFRLDDQNPIVQQTYHQQISVNDQNIHQSRMDQDDEQLAIQDFNTWVKRSIKKRNGEKLSKHNIISSVYGQKIKIDRKNHNQQNRNQELSKRYNQQNLNINNQTNKKEPKGNVSPLQFLKNTLTGTKSNILNSESNLLQSNTLLKTHHYYMVEILSISDILPFEFYRKQQQGHKLFYKLIISLQQDLNEGSFIQNGTKIYKKQIITEVGPLEKKKHNTSSHVKKINKTSNIGNFYTDEKLSIYFHTNKENVFLIIELVLYQVIQQQQQNTQIVISEQGFSFIRIPMNFKNQKSKKDKKQIQNNNSNINQSYKAKILRQKKDLLPKQLLFNDKIDINELKSSAAYSYLKEKYNCSYGTIQYSIIDSQYYKIISKLAPSQFLLNYQNKIPGLMGGTLPKVDDMLMPLTPSSQACSLTFQVFNIEISAQTIDKAVFKFQRMATKKFHNLKKVQIKEIKINTIFHNGMVLVHQQQKSLTEKMQIQKKIVQPSQINKFHRYDKKNQDQMLSIKHYSCPLLHIPTAFNQKDCYIIFQIYAKVFLRLSNDKNQKFKQSNEQEYLIPICFLFLSVDKIFNNKSVQKKFHQGHYLSHEWIQSYRKTKLSVKNATTQKSKSDLKGSIRNSIPESARTNQYELQNNMNRLTSHCSIKYTCQLKQAFFDEQWTTTKPEDELMLKAFGLNNKSSVMMNQSMKIQLQKQKIIRQNKKKQLKTQKRKIKTYQQIKELQVRHDGFYVIEDSSKLSQIKLSIFKDLKQHMKTSLQMQNSLCQNQHQQEYHSQNILIKSYLKQHKTRQFNRDKIQNSKFYLFKVNKSYNQKPYYKIPPLFPIHVRKMFSLPEQQESQNFNQQISSISNYSFQPVPLEIIKTELSEINFDYCILINPLQLRPLQTSMNQPYRIPDKFYFKIYFWNLQSSSIGLQIDPSTGQIITHKQNNFKLQHERNNEDDINKIFHFSFGNQSKLVNGQERFIQFVQYLYNGLMEVQMYNEFDLVGKSWFRLRNLIRRKKNQTSFACKQQIFSKNYGPIASLKLQFKSIRKQPDLRKKFTPGQLDKQQLSHSTNFNLVNSKQDDKNQNRKIIRSVFQNQDKQKSQQQIIQRFKKKKLSQNKKQNSLKNPFNNKKIGFQQNNTANSILQRQNHDKTKQSFSNLNYQKELRTDMIQRIIDKNYLVSQYHLKVKSFTKSYFFIELQNRLPYKGVLHLSVTDQDYKLYKKYYSQNELTIIPNLKKQLTGFEYEKFMSISKNRQKSLKLKKLDQNLYTEQEVAPGQKISVLCSYLSYRKYDDLKRDRFDLPVKQNHNEHSQFSLVNHFHSITISLLSVKDQSVVSSLSKIYIYPQPKQDVLTINQICKQNSRCISFLPFLKASDLYLNQQPSDKKDGIKSQKDSSKFQIFINDNKGFLISKTQTISSEIKRQNNIMRENNTQLTANMNNQSVNSNPQRFSIDQNAMQMSNRDSTSPEMWLDKNQIIPMSPRKKDYIKQNQKQEFMDTRQFRQTNNRRTFAQGFQNKPKNRQYNFLAFQASTYAQNSNRTIEIICKPYKTRNKKQLQSSKEKSISVLKGKQQSTNLQLERKPLYVQLNIQVLKQELNNNIKCILFQQFRSKLRIRHKQIQKLNDGKIPKIVGISSGDILGQFLQFQGKQLSWSNLQFKDKNLGLNKDFTEIEYSYTPVMYGKLSTKINIYDPIKYREFLNHKKDRKSFELNTQSSIQLLRESIIHSILLTSSTAFPPLKQILTLNLPSYFSKQTYEQPFIYVNSQPLKSVYCIFSTHPWILYVDQKQRLVQIKGKGEKKIKLKISLKNLLEFYHSHNEENTQNTMESNKIKGLNQNNLVDMPVVVIGFKSDKLIQYFGFRFKLVN